MAPVTRAKKAQLEVQAQARAPSLPTKAANPENKRVSLAQQQVREDTPDRRISGGSFRIQVSPASSSPKTIVIDGEEYVKIDDSESDNMIVDLYEEEDLASDGSSEDEFGRIRCRWCATFCEGTCKSSPDSCVTCFGAAKMTPFGFDYDPYAVGDMMEKNLTCQSEKCRCNCHKYVEQNLELEWVDYGDEPGLCDRVVPFVPRVKAEGLFNFIGLPEELRLHILRFALMAEGNYKQRFHYGKIHKNILLVSRDITKQAQHLPFSVNELIIPSPHLFKKATTLLRSPDLCWTQRIRVDLFESYELTSDYTKTVFKRLANMHIVQLNIFVYGLVTKADFNNNSEFVRMLKSLKHVRYFKIEIGCANLSEDAKDDIQERLRPQLTLPTGKHKLRCKRCVDQMNKVIEDARVEKLWRMKQRGASVEELQMATVLGTRNWNAYLEAKREQKRLANLGVHTELPKYVRSSLRCSMRLLNFKYQGAFRKHPSISYTTEIVGWL